MVYKKKIICVSGLCVLVLAVTAVGLQQAQISSQQTQINELETQLQDSDNMLNSRMDQLESDPDSLVSSYSESFAGVDMQERAVQIKVTITTA